MNSLKEDQRPSFQFYPDDWFSDLGLRLCSLSARGLWVEMLCIMWRAKVRGTLTINGDKVDGKTWQTVVGVSQKEIANALQELSKHKVYSTLKDGTIINRRMYRNALKERELSKVRSDAGRVGASKRWDGDNGKTIAKGMAKHDGKTIAKMAASTPTPTPTPSSIIYNNKKQAANAAVLNDLSTKKSTGTPNASKEQPFSEPTVEQKQALAELYVTLIAAPYKFNIFRYMSFVKKRKGYFPPVDVIIDIANTAIKNKKTNLWGYFNNALKEALPKSFADLNEKRGDEYKKQPTRMGEIMRGIIK